MAGAPIRHGPARAAPGGEAEDAGRDAPRGLRYRVVQAAFAALAASGALLVASGAWPPTSEFVIALGTAFIIPGAAGVIMMAMNLEVAERLHRRFDYQNRILDRHTEILDRHTEILDGHTVILDRHTEILDGHTVILDRHTEILDGHTVILREMSGTLKEMSATLRRIDRKIPEPDRAARGGPPRLADRVAPV